MSRLAWVNEDEDYSLDDINKNPSKYQLQGNNYDDVDSSYVGSIKEPSEFKFRDIERKNESPLYSGLKEAGRIGVGALASGISGLAGVPRNILGAANSLINMTRPEVRPEVLKNLESHPELKSFVTGNVIPEQYVPSGEDIKESIGKVLPEDYLKSSGQHQDFVNEIASDIGSMMFPLSGGTKISKALKVSGLGNLAKYLSKNLGVSEGTQEKIKTGTMLLSSLGFGSGIRDKGEELFKKADAEIPKTLSIKSNPIRKIISDSAEWTEKGVRGLKQKVIVRDIIKDLDEASSGNKIGVRDIIQFKRDVGNVLKQQARDLDKKDWGELQHQVSKIYKGLNSAIKNNPDVPKNISDLATRMDDIWSNVKQADRASAWIKSKSDSLVKMGGGAAAIGKIIGGNYSPIALSAAALGKLGSMTSGASGKVYSLLKNISDHPSVRNEYFNMLKAAAKENTPLFIKHANNAGKQLQKFSKEPELKSKRLMFVDE